MGSFVKEADIYVKDEVPLIMPKYYFFLIHVLLAGAVKCYRTQGKSA